MRIFVTGGTGFVGSHFLKQALNSGYEVLALRRANSQTRIPLPRQPIWIEGALDGDYGQSLENVDAFVHIASHNPNPPYSPLDECLYWDVYAALKLAQQAKGCGVKNFLIASSCFEYGQVSQDIDFIDVQAPLKPCLSYPTAKAAASIAFEGFAREHNLNLKLLRIFQVYGEGEKENRFWPSLRRAALSGKDFPMTAGAQLRDFVSVEDAAHQFLMHLDFNSVKAGEPEVHHIASGGAITLLEFAQNWWSYWGATGRLMPGALPYRQNELFRLAPKPLVNAEHPPSNIQSSGD